MHVFCSQDHEMHSSRGLGPNGRGWRRGGLGRDLANLAQHVLPVCSVCPVLHTGAMHASYPQVPRAERVAAFGLREEHERRAVSALRLSGGCAAGRTHTSGRENERERAS